jgi:hypothetical protein
MPNFRNVELTDMWCGRWQRRPSPNTVPEKVSRQDCIQFKNVYFHGATIKRHRKVPSKIVTQIVPSGWLNQRYRQDLRI